MALANSKPLKPCACGLTLKNSSHAASHKRICLVHQSKLSEILDQRDTILSEYKEKQSIYDIVLDYDKDYFGDLNSPGTPACNIVRKFLKREGVYDPFNKVAVARKSAASKKTTMERYGVVNVGCLPNAPRLAANKIPYKSITYLAEDFKEYRKKVELLTKRNANNMVPPEFCEYTGIRFVDAEPGNTRANVNPNDPRKRSADHVIPIISAYLNKIPAERAADPSNLRFCLRYVNSIKGNTLLESFMPLAAQIREVFIHEGYSHRPFTAEI